MPTKNLLAYLALCMMLLPSGGRAAPIEPTAPTLNTAESKPTQTDTPSPTTFSRVEAGRALNLGQLEAIQAETVLYEAQLARAKALKELQNNGYDRSLDQPFNPAPPSQDNKPAVKGAVQDAIPPQIVEITGTNSGYQAVLSLTNGNQVTVQAGNQIPGTDYIVKRITLNEVVVSGRNQTLVSLSFSG
ncbi:type IV pilus biogenesis protein PilP (plasmid) [Edwardsiella piscicida]|uniref:type IV pilus biogenesis protein PilP n=1 Tax=Edwardsiella TaxID=635 RepID=UPI001F028648|nr:type IV pilus biogenesis protein PilP [Edwardsiella piscicida]UJT80924.1 type IV pilus biogenesis protein PilP [Edwardsiella piscicida]